LKPVAEVDDIPKSWWNSVAEPSPMFPALLFGGSRLGRAAAVRRVADSLCMDVIVIRASSKWAFSDEAKRRLLENSARAFILFVEWTDNPNEGVVNSLCKWMEEGRFSIVVGTDAAATVPQALMRRFDARTRVPDQISGIPENFEPGVAGQFTVFGGRNQEDVDKALLAYASSFVAISNGVVIGAPSFEQAVSKPLPKRSFFQETNTLIAKNGGNDDKILHRAFREEHDHIWVQNFEGPGFREYEARTKVKSVEVFAFDIGHIVCGGMVAAATTDELFEKIARKFPQLLWLQSSDFNRRVDGTPAVRVAFEGNDISEEFIDWSLALGRRVGSLPTASSHSI
jgi:hypothetical protein